jgi:hypothetical protein
MNPGGRIRGRPLNTSRFDRTSAEKLRLTAKVTRID